MSDNKTTRFFLEMPKEVLLAWAKSQIALPLCWNCRAELLLGDAVCPVCGKNQDPLAEPSDDPGP